MAKHEKNHEDLFAKIATERLQQRDINLVEPEPVIVSQKPLPLKKGKLQGFKTTRKMTTSAQLRKELERYKKRYQKYMLNYAPVLPDYRESIRLTSFYWREERVQDRNNFNAVLAGKGKWQKVSVPHYGPPLGKAVTYYRTSFHVTRQMLDKGAVFACFDGVDYKAHVFINNAYLGSHEGFFSPFEFDFTPYAKVGRNVLVVKVENDATQLGNNFGKEMVTGDKIYAATGCGYDDPELGWHHCPPGMGIYQEVRVEARSRLFIHDLFIRPIAEQSSAEVWIDVHNCDVNPKPVEFEISLYGRNFKKTIFKNRQIRPQTCQHRGHGDVDQYNNDNIEKPAESGVNYYRIPIKIPDYRPWQLQQPWLYQLQVNLIQDNQVVDSTQQQFGMRSFVQDEDSQPKGKFYLNEREIRLRGANTMGHLQQCVMKNDLQQLRDDILLAKICNMNFLRLTQRPVHKKIYEYCDQLGMMTQTDLPLFGVLRRNKMLEAVKQAGEMEQLIRSHPCNIMVSYINEPYPNATGKPHRHLIRKELDEFFDIASKVVRQINPDRVIKYCDGDYDPPALAGMPDNHCYCGWYIGHGLDLGKLNRGYWIPVKKDWHYGCGEYGAEGLDNYEVMKKYYPDEWLPEKKDINAPWSPGKIPMAQSERFHYLWYETPTTLKEWIQASQDHQAWVMRMMTEAFRRDWQMNSFAVHLFIDAWPAGWMKTLMDVDRQPKKAFFDFRDALTPLMVSLRADRIAYHSGEAIELEAWICNDSNEIPKGCRLRYQLQCQNKVLQAGAVKADIPKCSSAVQGILSFSTPEVQARTTVSVDLALVDSQGKVLHDTSMTFKVFPAVSKTPQRRINVLRSRKDIAYQLATELGLKYSVNAKIKNDDTIFISNPNVYRDRKQEIDKAVQEGAIAVFFELPTGSYLIGKHKLEINEAGMGKRHFVACDTNHALINDFESDDYRFWYDKSVGYPTPILESVLSGRGWSEILTSGNGNWKSAWKRYPVVAEKESGKGIYRVCQVKLKDRLRDNPAAMDFMLHIIASGE